MFFFGLLDDLVCNILKSIHKKHFILQNTLWIVYEKSKLAYTCCIPMNKKYVYQW